MLRLYEGIVIYNYLNLKGHIHKTGKRDVKFMGHITKKYDTKNLARTRQNDGIKLQRKEKEHCKNIVIYLLVTVIIFLIIPIILWCISSHHRSSVSRSLGFCSRRYSQEK